MNNNLLLWSSVSAPPIDRVDFLVHHAPPAELWGKAQRRIGKRLYDDTISIAQ
jgi:hypothetical protein